VRTAGSAGTPQVSFGPCVSPRFGRPSTPLATYLWLVFAFLREWGRLAGAITRIAVTRQRIRTAGGLVPTTLRITGAPAGQAVAGAEKGLVNARRAVLRAVDNLMQLPVTSTTTAFRGTGTRCAISPGALDQHPQTGTPMGPHAPKETRDLDRTPDPGPQPGQIAGPTEKPGLQDQQLRRNPQIADRAHLSSRPPTFSGASSYGPVHAGTSITAVRSNDRSVHT
jgi:hypothetical protein